MGQPVNLDKSKECPHPKEHILAVPSEGDTTVSCIQRSVPAEGSSSGDESSAGWALLWHHWQQLCTSSRCPVWAAIWNVISLFLECLGLGCKMNSLNGTRRWWQHAFALVKMCALINICASLSKLEGLYSCKTDSDFSVLRFSQKMNLSFLKLQVPKCLKGSLTS